MDSFISNGKKNLKRLGPSSQYNKIEFKKGSNLIGRLNTGVGIIIKSRFMSNYQCDIIIDDKIILTEWSNGGIWKWN